MKEKRGIVMKKISENLFIFQDTCNVYVVKQKDSAVLIDFGAGAVLGRLHEIGVSKVAAVLITHHHRDQVQGLHLAAEQEIPIYVPHNEQELIVGANEHWQSRELLNNYNSRQDRFSILYSVPITGTLKDYEDFCAGDTSFIVIPTPGHTTGSVSLIANIDGYMTCFVGDLIFATGKLWSLAATQWTYNGGEGLPYTVLSLLSVLESGADRLLPSHGAPMTSDAIMPTIENLLELIKLRRQNPRLLQLRDTPYEYITPHVLRNRTSMSDSYVLVSESGKAMIIDFGYDFIAGIPAGVERSARRPWLYTIPALLEKFGVTSIDACLPTHYHDDHVAGFNLLKQVYGVKVICSDIFADILEFPSDYDLPCLWYDPIKVDMRASASFRWEEHEILLHPLPGHTRYAVAVEFIADGKRFLCGGDQYADSDGLHCNYVYKNVTGSGDFIETAELYNRIAPDYLLTGHWGAIPYTAEYGKEILERGKELKRLHDVLLPSQDWGNSFIVEFYPFTATVGPNAIVDVEVRVTNPLDKPADVNIEFCLPPGFTPEGSMSRQALPREVICFLVQLQVPDVPVRRERISCNVFVEGKPYGQQGEMLVSVV